MAAATGYELLRTFHPKHGEPLGAMPADAQEWMVLAIGFVVSFIVALAVVAWFMNWVRQRGFTPFAIYTGLSNLVSFGFNGIGVALIGRNHPLAIVLAGIFFGSLQAGASTLQLTGVSFEIVEVLEGMIIFAIAAPQLYRLVRKTIK